MLPVGGTDQVHDAWRLHHGLIRRSLARAYYQGWDMHPGHLPTRYAATYAFYREGLDSAAARLAAYTARIEGAVMDEPATARALSGYLLRGLDCGAIDPAEVAERTGLARPRTRRPGGTYGPARRLGRVPGGRGQGDLAGAAGDQADREHDPARLVGGDAVEAAEEQLGRAAAESGRVLGHHGDRRVEQVGELEVVEADQRDRVRGGRTAPVPR